ncbi:MULTISPECIES: YesL family protein [unclassified Actinotalea]|uniref:YesL family protein n=1 Tax=unclassified Actinotalea TaxID=2638618 RepID=UPI0015F44004|nr:MULTISPECIES: DUF624 domain-containing protein [unclassified Actinotalea]
MFSFEGFARINAVLVSAYRIAWLNVLWTVATVVGVVVLGIGPASYAMAKYVDRWFRLGETPPVARTFLRYALEQRWRPVLVSWVLLGAGAVITVNLLAVSNWYVRVLNIVALVVLAVACSYVFFVMAALDVPTIRGQITTALVIGFGSLHWTVLAAVTVAVSHVLMFSFALPLLLMFGVGIPVAVHALVMRGVLRQLDPSGAPDLAGPPRHAPTSRPAPGHLVRPLSLEGSS